MYKFITRACVALLPSTALLGNALRRTTRSLAAIGVVVASTLTSTVSHASHAPSYSRHTFELGPLGYRVGVLEVVDLNQDGLDDIVVVDYPPRDMHIYMAGSRLGHVYYYHCGPFPVPGGRDLVGYDLDPLDGLTDLVLAVDSGPAGGIYCYETTGMAHDVHGRPTPTFAPPVHHAAGHRMHMPHALAVGNLNDDQSQGRALDDLIIGQTNHEVGVGLAARGTTAPHTFLPYVGYAQQFFPRKLAVGDFDADGLNDIIYSGGTQAILPGLGVTWNEGTQNHIVFNHPTQLGASLGFFAPSFTSGERLPYYNGTSSIHQYATISDFVVVDVDGDLRQDVVFSTNPVSGNPSTVLPIQIFMNNGSRNVDPLTGAVYFEYGAPASYLLAALREPSEFVYVNRSQVPPELGYVRRALAPVEDEIIGRGPGARPILRLLTGECDGRTGTDVITVTGDLSGPQQFVEFYVRS
jgi:hypothetical protein